MAFFILSRVVVSVKEPIRRQMIPAVRNWKAERSTPLKAFPYLSIYMMWRAKSTAQKNMMMSPLPIPPSPFMESRKAPTRPPRTQSHIFLETFFPTSRERIGTRRV